jgi:hypothetical protein
MSIDPLMLELVCIFCSTEWTGFFPDGVDEENPESQKSQCPNCLLMGGIPAELED